MSGAKLIDRTHAEGTPWEKTYEEGSNKVIEDSLIKDYYKAIFDKLFSSDN